MKLYLIFNILLLALLLTSCAHISSRSSYKDTYLRTEKTPLEDKYRINVNYSFSGDHFFKETRLDINVTRTKICSEKEVKFYNRKELTENTIGDNKPSDRSTITTEQFMHAFNWIWGLGGTIYGAIELSSLASQKPSESSDPGAGYANMVYTVLGIGLIALGAAVIDSIRAIDSTKDLGEIKKWEKTSERNCGITPLKNTELYLQFEDQKILLGKTNDSGSVSVLLNTIGAVAELARHPWGEILVEDTITKKVYLPKESVIYLRELRAAQVVDNIKTYEEFLKNYPESNYAKEFRKRKESLEQEEQKEYEKLIAKNDLEAYRDYLEKHPDSIYAEDIEEKIRKIEEPLLQEQMRKAEEEMRKEEREYQRFLNRHCKGEMISLEDFYRRFNPYTDKGKCVELRAIRYQILKSNVGLFQVTSGGMEGQIVYIEFNKPIDFYEVEGVAKILGEFTYLTQKIDYNIVPKLKMIRIDNIQN